MDKQELAEVADRVEAFLNGFATPEAFLAACEARGIKATPDDCLECAIALLIRDQFPEIADVATVEVQPNRLSIPDRDRDYGEFTLRLDEWPDSFEKRRLTEQAVEFAVKFDYGKYPAITAEEWYDDDDEDKETE